MWKMFKPILSDHYHDGLLHIECILVLEEVTLWFAVKLVFYSPQTHSTQHTGSLSVLRTDTRWLGLVISLHAYPLSQNQVVTG